MSDSLEVKYNVEPGDFTRAGEASAKLKRMLKTMGMPPDVIRKAAIAIYEGEINMVIHADGGDITVNVSDEEITMVLKDKGPGIEDVEKAMQAGYSTASESARNMGFGAGMGLPNMKKYTDDLQIETEKGVGTTLTMKIKL